jgi:TolB protein
MKTFGQSARVLKAVGTVLAVIGLLPVVLGIAQASSGPAPGAAPEDAGIIAYVRRSTHDIHLISPDGSGDRALWTAPRPLSVHPAYDLAWRPDGRELTFSSDHEETCSWYQSDVYAMGYTGAGYRRVTNSPACAALATLPKGSVTLHVTNWTSSLVQVYVQGAPGVKSVFDDGTVTLNNVADFGPGVRQPAVGIYGGYRIMASLPAADVQPNATVPGGNLIISKYSGIDAFGAGKISWKADGSALAYGMRTYSRISQIPATPPYGSIGEPLPVVEYAAPNLVAWGPTAATKDQYIYSSKEDSIHDEVAGIYLNTVGNTSGGTMLVRIYPLDGQMVHDIEWLPDASGFLFSAQYVDYEIYTNIFEYQFATEELTRLTSLPREEGARGLSISPDGQYVVFEWTDRFDTASSLWIMNRDGSGLHRLVDDAGRPAWGRAPAPLDKRVYLPLVAR